MFEQDGSGEIAALRALGYDVTPTAFLVCPRCEGQGELATKDGACCFFCGYEWRLTQNKDTE